MCGVRLNHQLATAFAASLVALFFATTLSACQRTSPPSVETASAQKAKLGELIESAVHLGLGSQAEWHIRKTCSGKSGCYNDNNFGVTFTPASKFASKHEFCEPAFHFASSLNPDVVGQNIPGSKVDNIESAIEVCSSQNSQQFELWTVGAKSPIGYRYTMHIANTDGKESISLYLFE